MKKIPTSILHRLRFLFLLLAANLIVLTINGQQVDTVATIEEDRVEVVEDEEQNDKNYFEEKEFYDAYAIEKEQQLPENYKKQLKEDEDFWYANTTDAEKSKPQEMKGTKGDGKVLDKLPPPKPDRSDEERREYTPISRRSWFQTLLWILVIVGFIAILGFYLSSSNVGFFRKKDKKLDTEPDHEEMPEDIFAINYLNEIDKAAAQGNYRLAIRLQYLRMLKNMAEKNIINYKQDKTNLDYMMELQPTQYYQNFFKVTRHYEYSWYGKFDVSSETYAAVRQGFDQFENQIKT